MKYQDYKENKMKKFKSCSVMTISDEYQQNIGDIKVSYLVRFVDPNMEYVVSYSIYKGKKTIQPTTLLGSDLTQNQILELFLNEKL